MYKYFLKRFIDIILSGFSLVILFPLFIIVVILIKVDSSGPIFYTQNRLGKKGRLFLLYKFRSMTNKKRTSHKQVFAGDPEVTKVGNVLRRLKIDELPQLMNVLWGDMSIVGPRPCLPEVKVKFGEYADKRLDVKPGLSSLAAIKGSIYLSWEEKGYWDVYYTDNYSLSLDIKIILNTFKVIVLGEKKLFEKKH